MKTTLTTSNENTTKLYDLLQENEFFNFDMKNTDFYTQFVFENLTEEQIELVENLEESVQ